MRSIDGEGHQEKVSYDSSVCPFSDTGLFEKVKGVPIIAVVAFTTDGDVFGGFYSSSVIERNKFSTSRLVLFSRLSRTGGA